MPTEKEIAERHGFTFPGDLKLRFTGSAPMPAPVKRDIPPAPQPRDLPKREQRPQPVDIPRLLNESAFPFGGIYDPTLADNMMLRRMNAATLANISSESARRFTDDPQALLATMKRVKVAFEDMALAERMEEAAARKKTEGQGTFAHILTTAAQGLRQQAEAALGKKEKGND
jgi:hypothetical protein